MVDASPAAGGSSWPRLAGLVQEGFALHGLEGQSLRNFMRGPLGMDDAYIEGSVSTVFLDYKPVDDLDSAAISADCLVSLSAAMPGLVGAVMRRNSPYASFREAISHDGRLDSGVAAATRTCLVRVKLFNAIMREHGPVLLQRGILVRAARLAEILGKPLPPGYSTVPSESDYLLLCTEPVSGS
ncbi:MAG: hypothetical protein A3J97_06740 [Spirochaetes bacterium RIFOXYC1_FULL_54_7]|nr:MAG: hypothetical protein A3J97_06740 [Spirochaetes bacterium RIFOXYC1_FULL_54_7]